MTTNSLTPALTPGRLLAELQERDYRPADGLGPLGEQWFDLATDGPAIVRLVVEDDGDVKVHLLNAGSYVVIWSTGWTHDTPSMVALAILDTVEDYAGKF